MKNAYLILLTTELYFNIVECVVAPDINLEGRLIANNDSIIFQLICSTNIAVQLCTVEFLLDKKTHDNIRYFDNNCYHTLRICPPTVCTCSGDCRSFTLNVTVTQDMKNTIYSCASRIKSKEVTYSANTSIIQDGNGGSTIFKKIVVPSNIVSPPQQAPTIFPEKSTVASLSAPSIFIGSSVGLLVLIVSVIVIFVMYRKRCCSKCYTKSELEKNSSPIDRLAVSAGFPPPMTLHTADRRWNLFLPTLECEKKQDALKHVKYTRKKEKRLTVSTISTHSGSLHSLDDVVILPSELSSSYA